MVHIKKVEIFGFKSFGFKNTTIDFQPGLVSISGPNGSGKSNILDAIIFALGENRPKVMRADKLRSLIHDIEGAQRRGPKMARASVHFDNSDRKIPVDSDSVEITREMDDKGENIYYLNKKKTQRGQVLDLLDMANAGLNQLNAVQQGTVTRISEFSSEEKRQVIEDLVGLSYFDEKKSEAEKQLQTADQRLEVAMAKMGEVKKQIDNLEEERNLKLRHDFIEKEVARLNAIDAANKMKSIKANKISKEQALGELESESTKFNEELAVVKKEIEELETKKSAFMKEVNEFNQAKASIDSELSDAMHKFEEINSTVATRKKRIIQIENRFPQITEEIELIQQQRGTIESEISQQKESIEKIGADKKKINTELQIIDSALEKVAAEQSRAASQKREVDQKIKKLTGDLHDAQLSLKKFESEKNELEQKIVENTSKNIDIEKEQQNLVQLRQKLLTTISNHKSTVTELKSRISEFDSKKIKFEKDIEDLNSILEKSSKAATHFETKIKVVKGTMHEDYTVAKLKEDADQLGIMGIVYEMITWDKQFEHAIMATSSDWIKAIVVKDFTTLINIAEFARHKQLPKLKIIPLDAIPKFKLDPPNEKGVIGILSDYVKCDSKFTPIKKFLFGNVVLTESKESAHDLSKKGYKAVSLSGSFFEAKSSAVVVDINSKISNLTKIISQSTSIDGLLQSVVLLKKFVQKKKNSLKKIDETIDKYEDRLSLSETELATAEHRNSDLSDQISRTQRLMNSLTSRIEQQRQRIAHLETEVAKQSSFVDSLNQRLAIVKENYEDGEQIRISHEIARLNKKKAELQKQLTGIIIVHNEKTSELVNLNTKDAHGKSQIRALQQENDDLILEKQEIENTIDDLEKQKEKANQELVALRQKEQEIISTSGTSVSQLQEYDEKLKILNERDKSLTKETSNLERQSDSLRRDLKELYEREESTKKIIDAFGLDENAETFDVTELLQPLFAEQKGLTELNAKAPATYLTISEGYRSMSTRKNSLEEERNSIVHFIESIEKDKRQTFLDAFDKVDKEIRSIFSKMTGGNAWLELQNEDDIFSSGISYLIQFQNKPKRESTSISGGEKTLAAVVFVLALQKLKPSPFYLFDEVDAHLDAPNSEKLGKILAERSKESQFLMVSLKDSVVQRAQLIYGVFPKNGVSHVVTYKDKRLQSMTT
ncbi:MAG TPA: chromosome segregation SMC family protein [Nitrosopumilaceae archaeon]|nr:chromosome segregation SMC family protein [Nitrosopumilaceae archaeon]